MHTIQLSLFYNFVWPRKHRRTPFSSPLLLELDSLVRSSLLRIGQFSQNLQQHSPMCSKYKSRKIISQLNYISSYKLRTSEWLDEGVQRIHNKAINIFRTKLVLVKKIYPVKLHYPSQDNDTILCLVKYHRNISYIYLWLLRKPFLIIQS